MTEETAEDRERRYLVPVARLNLAGQPDVIHLSVYQWMPAFQGWATGMAICGYSTQQGPLPKAPVTCPECLKYRPRYERMLAPGYRPEDDDPDVLRAQLAAARSELAELKGERGDAPSAAHVYLSTGCLHGEHAYCQSMTGQQGEKRPAQCKFCQARCTCSCHNEGETR